MTAVPGPSIIAYASESHKGTTLPSSSQGITVPYRTSVCSSVSSPGPTLSYGSGYLPASHQDLLTHLSPSARSVFPQEYTVPEAPALHPHSQPQVISNIDSLSFDFLPVAESCSLPPANPTPPYDPTWGKSKSTSFHAQNLTRVLTTRDIVPPEFPPVDPFGFGSIPDGITVSGSITSSSVIRLRDSAGCHPA